jgi:hypothetical protein
MKARNLVYTNLFRIELTPIEKLSCLLVVHRNSLNHIQIKKYYSLVGDKRIYKQCENNQIESISADALGLVLGNDSIPSHWREAHSIVKDKIEAFMRELDFIADIFGKRGITLVALKNSGITRALYPFYGSCPMGDVDVLIEKESFSLAHKLLIENGYTLKFRSSLEVDTYESALEGGGAEYFKMLKSGAKLWFELQWRPIAGRWITPDREPKAQELISRSTQINGSFVHLLSPEDNLLQVCIHTGKHSYVRAPGFRLHTDVDRIVRSSLIKWPLFIELANKHRVRTVTFFSLALASDLLGTPIPMQVMRELCPPSWKLKLIRKSLLNVGLFDPDGKKWNKITYLYFVSLLFDSVHDIFTNLFLAPHEKFNGRSETGTIKLSYLYIRRIAGLLWKRNMA